MQTDKPRVRQSDLLSEEMHGERVIYDNRNKKVHHLNPTMSWVWSHCDGSRTIDELIAALQSDTGCDDARGLITSGLKQLAEANLLEPGSVDLTALGVQRSTVSRRAAVIAGISIAVTDNDLDPCTHASSGEIAPGKRWQKGQEGEEGQISWSCPQELSGPM